MAPTAHPLVYLRHTPSPMVGRNFLVLRMQHGIKLCDDLVAPFLCCSHRMVQSVKFLLDLLLLSGQCVQRHLDLLFLLLVRLPLFVDGFHEREDFIFQLPQPSLPRFQLCKEGTVFRIRFHGMRFTLCSAERFLMARKFAFTRPLLPFALFNGRVLCRQGVTRNATGRLVGLQPRWQLLLFPLERLAMIINLLQGQQKLELIAHEPTSFTRASYGPAWVRTRDRPVMSRLLYHLSYRPLWPPSDDSTQKFLGCQGTPGTASASCQVLSTKLRNILLRLG